jgi:hypothetical protein
MYNLHCLEWHLDVDGNRRTPQSTVWSCQTTNELLISVIRFVVALAKSQDHRAFCGVFAFADRTPHDSSESAWTAWKKTPHTSTPLVQNVTSVDLATGKAHSTSVVNKAVCISEQIRQAHLGLFCFSS